MLPWLGASSPESMLMSVDLPAPFVPMTAWISPTCRSSQTASTATSPPKRRPRPVQRSSASGDALVMAAAPRAPASPGGVVGSAMSGAAQARTEADQAARQEGDEGDDRQAEA